MRLKWKVTMTVAAACFGYAAVGWATPVGFSLGLHDLSAASTNMTFQLRNNSTSAQIDAFAFTIGDTAFQFDFVAPIVSLPVIALNDTGTTLSTTVVLPTPNADGDLSSDDSFKHAYTGFDPGDEIRFVVDVDRDGASTVEDSSVVFFRNGSAPNSTLSVTFSTGEVLSATFPENPSIVNDTVELSQGVSVPEGPTLLLLTVGLLGTGAVRRRRSPRCVRRGKTPRSICPLTTATTEPLTNQIDVNFREFGREQACHQ